MSRRIASGIERGPPVTIHVDGRRVAAFAGETVATALLAAGLTAFRRDKSGRPRGLFCNMGTCSECFVRVGQAPGGEGRRLRACLTPIGDGMTIETEETGHGGP